MKFYQITIDGDVVYQTQTIETLIVQVNQYQISPKIKGPVFEFELQNNAGVILTTAAGSELKIREVRR